MPSLHRRRGGLVKEYSITIREKLRRIDPVVLLCVLGMNIMSIITLAAASDAYGSWYVRNQIFVSVIGLIAMGIIGFIDYDALIQKLKWFFFAATILLILWVIGFGEGSLGNSNWITFPGTNFSIQPTEFSKITFMITFAVHLDAVKKKINHPLSILQLAIHAGIVLGLMLIQGDLGMTLVYVGITALMLFGAGVSLWYFGGAFASALIASPFLWSKLSLRQQQRILFGFNPDLDPQDIGWQPIASRKCIIAGGFRGAGFSGGSQYYTLTHGQSDFIFSVLAEKFGFIGTFLYLLFLSVLILRILWIARNTRKNYASYLLIGIAGMLIVQSVENIGMCLAILPVVGITLPFLSYGASSILSMYVCMGLVQSICTHNRKYYFERESE